MGQRYSRFVQRLLSEEVLSAEQVEEAAALRAGSKRSLLECVTRLGFLDETSLLEMLSTHTKREVVDLAAVHPDPELVEKVPYRVAHERGLLPLCQEARRVVVAVVDPTDILALDVVGNLLGATVRPVIVRPSELERALQRAYKVDDVVAFELLGRFAGQGPDATLGETQRIKLGGDLVSAAAAEAATPERAPGSEAVDRSPVVQIVDAVLQDAVRQGASDVHLEPHKGVLLVRFRIDGVLRDVQIFPKTIRAQITSRVKIVASMDITESRKPQDARARIEVDGDPIDLRVSTLPTIFGEKVVVRILDSRNLILDLAELFPPEELDRFEELLRKPQGLLLVTGPTGSGKTTTLYSAMHALEDRAINIVTLEDPVEYRLPELNQVEIDEDHGLGFADALRSVLRQDPNVVLLGEIRDAQTARVAYRAAATGHLILTTVHTNDAASTVTRLRDLGVDPALIAEGTNGIVAQRLFRRLCRECREPYVAAEKDVHGFRSLIGKSLFRPKGCEECGYNGYRGRAAAYEIVPVLPSVQELIVTGAAEQELRRHIRGLGVVGMFDHGLRRVVEGDTTLEELLRHVPRDPVEAISVCESCREPLERGFRACPRCGAHAGSACGECGKELRAGWAYCAWCGADVLRSTEKRGGDGAVAAPAPLAIRPPADSDAPTPPKKPQAPVGVGRGREVLVIDDARIMRIFAGKALQKAGYRVRLAQSGEDGLREIARSRPDAVVLDYQMPDMNGIEVLRRLRKRLETATLPVLLCTAQDGERTEAEAKRAGANDYLCKPVKADTLVTRVSLAIERFEQLTGTAAA